jgi:ribosomal protein S18 acetylase RimI-like enzyme
MDTTWASASAPLLISYFKRFRMEISLDDAPPPPPLPAGYEWLAWRSDLLDAHAAALAASFQGEIDAAVFPSLGGGVTTCRALMLEIVRKPGFLPGATWLVACDGQPVGTVQGLRDRNGLGAIQNLGVVPGHRGRGLGETTLLRALAGFREAGLSQGLLEVTARNESAVRLYHRLGFRRRKTLYKAVETGGAR